MPYLNVRLVALRIVSVAEHTGRSRLRFGPDTMLMVTSCLQGRLRSSKFVDALKVHCLERGWILNKCPDPSKGWSLQKTEELNTFMPVAWKPEFQDLVRLTDLLTLDKHLQQKRGNQNG